MASQPESVIGGAGERPGRRTGSASGLADSRVREAGSGRAGKSSKHPNKLTKFRVGSVNVNTLRGRRCEVVEMLSRRSIDVCAVQETRYRNGHCCMVTGKDSKYKLYWSGNSKGTAGVGVFLAEKWIQKVFEVKRVSDRIILIKLVVGLRVLNVLSIYAPQSGLSDNDKDNFYDQLRAVTAEIPASEILLPCGDWNGHVGSKGTGYEEVHGGHGYGILRPDAEGERILEFALANDLLLGNTWYKKRDSHLVTYESGGATTQIDFIMYRKSMRRMVTDVKVIPGEECAPQHHLLVCDMLLDIPPLPKRKFTPRLKTWKLKDPATRERFKETFTQRIASSQEQVNEEITLDTEGLWANLRDNLLKTTEEVCGMTKPQGRWRQQTWWWNDLVDSAVKEKRRLYKAWRKGTATRAEYDTAKGAARRAVYHARHEAEKSVFADIDPRSADVYRLANQMRRENADVVGDKPVRNDAGDMSTTEEAKQQAWLEHYERLLNVEFDWDADHLSDEPPLEGPPIPITLDMVKKALGKMSSGKAAGPSGIVVEMIHAAGDTAVSMIRDLAVSIIKDGKVPADWEESFIVCLYKGKGDALDRGNYRGLKLTEQVMKILERIIDSVIRGMVSIDDSQFGFVPGRGTTDAIFVVRQLQEKFQAANKRLYMAFVDLEKAFDRVPRKVIWWAMRKLGVEEWVIRLVQGMYENARSRVRVGDGFSGEFGVLVGVHQGSVLSPLLFIIVLEALSREFRVGVPWEDLYADDLVIIADSLDECVNRLKIWKEGMEKKGLRVNAKKTKVLICGEGLDTLRKSGKYPCGVCFSGVGSSSIYCGGCKKWIHKKCSGLKQLVEDPTYRCARCLGVARAIDGRPMESVMVGDDSLEVVDSFCYLGDMLCAGGGCSLAVTTRVKTAWKKFRELSPVLTTRHLSPKTRGRIYNTCVRSAMLHASETWPLTKPILLRLIRNDRAMIRQLCHVKPDEVEQVRSNDLLKKTGLQDLEVVLRGRRLQWYGHVERSSGAIKCARDLAVEGQRGPGRPKMSWRELTERDRKQWKLQAADPHDKKIWRSSVRSAMMCAASK